VKGAWVRGEANDVGMGKGTPDNCVKVELLVELLRASETDKKRNTELFFAEIQFGTWEHMLLPPKKHFEMSKNSNKKILTYVSTFYVCTSSFAKNDISCEKNKQNVSYTTFFYSSFLQMTIKMSVFCGTTL
jgi:hypothetical protein